MPEESWLSLVTPPPSKSPRIWVAVLSSAPTAARTGGQWESAGLGFWAKQSLAYLGSEFEFLGLWGTVLQRWHIFLIAERALFL